MSKRPYGNKPPLEFKDTSSLAFLKKPEAAEYLRISVRTLDRLDIPRVKIRGTVLYRRKALDMWAESQEAPK